MSLLYIVDFEQVDVSWVFFVDFGSDFIPHNQIITMNLTTYDPILWNIFIILFSYTTIAHLSFQLTFLSTFYMHGVNF